MKVIYLAFANDQLAPLPTLQREDDGVFSALVNRALKGHFFIHRESYTTREKINQYLGKYGEDLAVFLYSGHAGKHSLLLDGEEANAKGITHQLSYCARKGELKLVLLNGCSTAGQVEALLNAGVPAVVATHAPVGDFSATEFSLRFFQCLSEKRLSIRQAFEEALGPAQTATDQDLGINGKEARSVGFRKSQHDNQPLWELFYNFPEAVDINPLPLAAASGRNASFVPNEQLTRTLYDTLYEAGNRDIRNLREKEEDGEYVEVGDKQTAIVNVLPYPVAIHLQKLLCPVEQENEGWDKVSLRRLEQAALVFHTALEFMAFVMISELWGLRLKGLFSELPAPLAKQLYGFFHLPPEERKAYAYLPLIRAIRVFLESLGGKEGFELFVEELTLLKTLAEEGHPFAGACGYLTNLRRQAVAGNIMEQDIPDMCEEAEDMLCQFFAPLGFLHHYILTSIQNIDIQKYRHNMEAVFSHEVVRLMRAFGKPEQQHYLSSRFFDNRGVVLIKGKAQVINQAKKLFQGEGLHFLNLSPFVIDRNAFESNTDLSNLLFYNDYRNRDNCYSFLNVKRPESVKDSLTICKEGPFEAVFQQLEAFRTMFLNENP